jgi:hypothetical protein
MTRQILRIGYTSNKACVPLRFAVRIPEKQNFVVDREPNISIVAMLYIMTEEGVIDVSCCTLLHLTRFIDFLC